MALGHAAIAEGARVRYLVAAELLETLRLDLADNSVGRVIDGLLRHDLVIVDEIGFAPLDATGTKLLFRFAAAAYEQRSLAFASHFSIEEWVRLLPEHTTAASLLDRLLHNAVMCISEGEEPPHARGPGAPPTAARPRVSVEHAAPSTAPSPAARAPPRARR